MAVGWRGNAEVRGFDGANTGCFMTDAATLRGRVAVVTGGSRGVGRGIAEALGEAGATVYVTGRTVADTQFSTSCIPVQCDHTDDDQVARAFEAISAERDRIDLLINNVWGGYERMVEDGEFTWSRLLATAFVALGFDVFCRGPRSFCCEPTGGTTDG